jgi:predicted O-methyltransferase YrrM
VGAGPVGRESARRRLSSDDVPAAASPLHVLRFLAAALRARAVVEVGTGSGETARWLLQGMAPDGVLTSIDIDPAAQRAARAALAEDGIPAGRTRMIAGLATQVLPRLTEGGYDLVVVATATTELAKYLELGIRLLRPGGVIAFAGVGLDEPRDDRSATALARRELSHVIEADETLVPVVLPVGPGLLAIAKT